MVPPCSDRVSRAPPYFSLPQSPQKTFTYGTITHYGRHFHTVRLVSQVSATGLSPFARHYSGNLGWFLFLELLRCFSSPGSPLKPMNSVWDILKKGWVSPFGYRGINALLPTPPRFSQAYTSFVASLRQGIHHKHLVAWSYNTPSSKFSDCGYKCFSTYNLQKRFWN